MMTQLEFYPRLALAGLCLLLAAGCQPAGTSKTEAALAEAMNRGVSLMGQYQYDQAVHAFEEALKHSPNLAAAKINLAIARFNRGRKEDQDLDRSSQLLEAVLAQEPQNVRAMHFLGLIHLHSGRAEPALALFENVAKQRPEDGAVWYLLGLSRQRVGQPAEQDLLRAIQYRPYLASAYYKLSQLAMGAGDEAKAAKYLEQFKRVRESPLAETIELPQYNQMGDLALVQPLAARGTPPITKSAYAPRAAQTLAQWKAGATGPNVAQGAWGGLAVGDLNRDDVLDLALVTGQPGAVKLFLDAGKGTFKEATLGSGVEIVTNALSLALGDYDNDEVADLFVAGVGGNFLFKGKGDGAFVNVTKETGLGGGSALSRSALFWDADHDGDLDIYVCNAGLANGGGPASNALWNNNGDGTFTNIAASAGLACADGRSVLALPGDLDGDRDSDLVVLQEGAPAKVFLNDLLGQFHAAAAGLAAFGDRGGILQDFNGDRALDLLVLGGNPPTLQMFAGDGRGHFKSSDPFLDAAKTAASWGDLRGFRVADADLDGDWDIAVFAGEGHLLLNDGSGRFVLRGRTWTGAPTASLAGAEWLDLDGDWVPDLAGVGPGNEMRLVFSAGELSPPSTGFGILTSGIRSRDKRTRSPANGFGVQMTARADRREQIRLYNGLFGGANQSSLPVAFGLAGAGKADYVQLQWPDGVAQIETALAAGQLHKVAEVQRKISSCPVLFTWNGERFEFVTDFAGVGGLGYFSAPGVSAPPQVEEHVKIEPNQLRAREGYYELRIHEPMEETAYLDRLELLAVDHRADQWVYPDERLAIHGPQPSHALLVVEQPIFPARALDPLGRDCTDRLRRVDRTYAYDPPLDRRYCGFCRPHTLELDFGREPAKFGAGDKVYLFLNGFIEYPYSQTVYAAGQSRIGWEPIQVERLGVDGRWQVIVPDGGAPGGMARTFTIELTGRVLGPECKLRLTTNLEIYYDQIFIGRDAGARQVTIRSLPMHAAELRRVGFAREYSPDGRLPLIYDYDLVDATAPFHVLRGAYTRLGNVRPLLERFDDQYVIMGPGDEVALRFQSADLPPAATAMQRSFVFVSHAYCKDMDLYTATPETVKPLPFKAMSRYPYPATERYPETDAHREYQAAYNTRLLE